MVTKIVLKFGPSGTMAHLSFDPGVTTVFVGPNNSGKSLILREIEEFCRSGEASVFNKLRMLANVSVALPEFSHIMAFLSQRRVGAKDTETFSIHEMQPTGTGPSGIGPFNPDILQQALETSVQPHYPFIYYVRLVTIRLDGKTRLQLTEPKSAGNLQSHPANILMALVKDNEARAKVREMIKDAFGSYFVIDPTAMTEFRVRLSNTKPLPHEELSLDEHGRAFHSNAADINSFSDGVKAFTGLIAAIMCSEYRILLIDEPEAFLHPPLAKKLGYTLATISAGRKGTVFASTHSADFLLGCMESGQPINVIRLTYSTEMPTARALPSSELRVMMRDPLLRSTNVLKALFYSGAIICEADADRALYEEINVRLSMFGEGAARDCIFLNAQNKQTVVRITSPLRQMGIPAAAIVDLDIVKGAEDFKRLLHGSCVPQALINSWGALRGEIYARMKTEGINPKSDGLSKLKPETQESLSSLLKNLETYGIFVPPEGSMESWLSALGVSGYSAEWLVSVFEKLGHDPADPLYVKPGRTDVWEFLRNIAHWVADPARHGMP